MMITVNLRQLIISRGTGILSVSEIKIFSKTLSSIRLGFRIILNLSMEASSKVV